MKSLRMAIFFGLIFLLFTEQGACAVYYLNASAGQGGKGTQSSPWGYFSELAGLAPGDMVNIAGTFRGEALNIVWSGTAGNPVTFQQWPGKSPWIIDGQNTLADCLYVKSSHVVVKNAEIHHSKTTGVVIIGTGLTGIRLDDVKSHDNRDSGFYCAQWTDGTPMTEIQFNNCFSYNNGAFGFHHVGCINGVTHYKDQAFNNGTLTPAHGFSSHAMRTTISDTNWTKFSGTIYFRDMIGVNTYRVVDHSEKIDMLYNPGAYASLSAGEWDKNGSRVYINVGKDISKEIHSIDLITTECKNIKYYYCIAHHNKSQPGGYVEGHGFSFDDYTSESFAYGCISFENAGHGLMANMTVGTGFFYCTSYKNNGQGINFSRYSQNIRAWNNTLYGNKHSGIQLFGPTSNVLIQNNIIYKNTEYGIDVDSYDKVFSVLNNYNCLNGNALGPHHNMDSAPQNITADPLMISPEQRNFHLKPHSPCIDSGTDVGLTEDGEGHSVPKGKSVDMGAYEFLTLKAPEEVTVIR